MGINDKKLEIYWSQVREPHIRMIRPVSSMIAIYQSD